MKSKLITVAIAAAALVLAGGGAASAQPFIPTNVTVNGAISVAVDGTKVANVFAEGKTCAISSAESSFYAKRDLIVSFQVQQQDGAFVSVADDRDGAYEVLIDAQLRTDVQPDKILVKSGELVTLRHYQATDGAYRVVARDALSDATALDISFVSRHTSFCGTNDIVYFDPSFIRARSVSDAHE